MIKNIGDSEAGVVVFSTMAEVGDQEVAVSELVVRGSLQCF